MSELNAYATWGGSFLMASAMMFAIHETGHAVLCKMAGVQVRGIGLGILSGLFVLRFDGDKPTLKWTPRRAIPHIVALAPPVGWWRIAIAAAGPLAGFSAALVMLAFGHGDVFSHEGAAQHPFSFGVEALGLGTLLNLVPFISCGVPTDGAYILTGIRRMRAERQYRGRNLQ